MDEETHRLFLEWTEKGLIELRTRPYHEALAMMRELSTKLVERGAESEKLRMMELDLAGES